MKAIVADTILVRGPNWVGDLVMSTPGFRALRAAFPDAHLRLQVRPGLEALLCGSPFFDSIGTVTSYHKGLRALLLEASDLRRTRRFDLGICLPTSFSSALLQRLGGVHRVVGFRGNLRGPLLHDVVIPPARLGRRLFVAREAYVLALMAALQIPSCGSHLELFTTSAEEGAAAELRCAAGIKEQDRVVLMAPGASFGTSKLWPAASYAMVGDALAQKGVRVVLVGAPSEADWSRRVALGMEQPVTDFTGRMDLGAAKALIRNSDLVIANDAGARHIAVAFGVPCIVFFGPTSVEKTNWNLKDVFVMEAEAGCRPCYKRECPIDHRCMTRIDAHAVISRADEILARAS